MPKAWGPPELPRFNVSPVNQLGVTGLDPTPESRFLMMRILDPGRPTDAEVLAAVVGDHGDWVPLFWMGLHIAPEGGGTNIHATG
jgi:hypothetical protein